MIILKIVSDHVPGRSDTLNRDGFEVSPEVTVLYALSNLGYIVTNFYRGLIVNI